MCFNAFILRVILKLLSDLQWYVSLYEFFCGAGDSYNGMAMDYIPNY